MAYLEIEAALRLFSASTASTAMQGLIMTCKIDHCEALEQIWLAALLQGDELEEFPPFPEGAVDEVLARWKLDTLLNFASQIVR